VIAERRKSTVYMSNQVCPGVPVGAIVKMEVPSVSGGYSAADTFSDDRTDASLYDVPLVRQRFSASYRF